MTSGQGPPSGIIRARGHTYPLGGTPGDPLARIHLGLAATRNRSNDFFFSLTGPHIIPSFLANIDPSKRSAPVLVLVRRRRGGLLIPEFARHGTTLVLLLLLLRLLPAARRPPTRTLRETCTNSDV